MTRTRRRLPSSLGFVLCAASVVGCAETLRGTNFQLSPVAFTAQKHSAVVYVERLIHGGMQQSYTLLLVGRQADGHWTTLDHLGSAVSVRSLPTESVASAAPLAARGSLFAPRAADHLARNERLDRRTFGGAAWRQLSAIGSMAGPYGWR